MQRLELLFDQSRCVPLSPRHTRPAQPCARPGQLHSCVVHHGELVPRSPQQHSAGSIALRDRIYMCNVRPRPEDVVAAADAPQRGPSLLEVLEDKPSWDSRTSVQPP